ncbi:MAG: glycosyltransferase [Muribaculaceae bacterium]|nr:glycosyltransferase [Muribaculaceae bacterium]
MDILHLTTNPELSISVIVPAYNCGEFLHNCVLSILTSIDQNSEVLIINDGSTDNTIDVAHNMSIRDIDLDVDNIVNRFKSLPFKNKICFSPSGGNSHEIIEVPELRNLNLVGGDETEHTLKHLDILSFINSLK